MMRIQTLWLIGISIAALPVACRAEAPASGPQPKIELVPRSLDGGVVEEGTLVPYRFTVKNVGLADLEIRKVSPSCGCTVTRWVRVIKPGSDGVIDAQMNTVNFRGAVTKHLTVDSNDPEHPELDLTISARVTPLIMVQPNRAGTLTLDDRPVTYEWRLERNGGKPMRIEQIIQGLPYIKTEVTPLPGAGRYRLLLTVSSDVPYGRTVVPVLVKTDQTPVPNVQLVLTVDRGIVTVPPMVFYGLLPSELKSPTQAAVTLMRQEPAFHIKTVEANDPRLQPKLETIREGSEYRVTVIYAGGWTAGLQAKKLTVTTDDPKQPVLEIPIQAVVQQRLSEAPVPGSGQK